MSTPTIDDPIAPGSVTRNFLASGRILPQLELPPPDERTTATLDPDCWMKQGSGGTEYHAKSSNRSTSAWSAVFDSVPVGTGYTLYVKLGSGDPVTSGPFEVRDLGGVIGLLGSDAEAARAKPAGKDAKSAAGAARARAADAAPIPIPVHAVYSRPIPPNLLNKLRSISAAFVAESDGTQLTPVFDAEIDRANSEYRLPLNLRQAVGKQGYLDFRVEFWPNSVTTGIDNRLMVVVADPI